MGRDTNRDYYNRSSPDTSVSLRSNKGGMGDPLLRRACRIALILLGIARIASSWVAAPRRDNPGGLGSSPGRPGLLPGTQP